MVLYILTETYTFCNNQMNYIILQLPGTDLLLDYAFKYGRCELIEMPLTINPSGCARTEPKLRTHFRK